MPEVVSKADMPTRKREGAGRSRVYVVDLSPLEGIAGQKDENGNELAVKYTPADLLAPNGEVAQLSTFLAQAREWVKEFNETDAAGGTEYRIKAQNYPIRDENGNHVRGTWDAENNVPVPSEDEDATKLYNSFVFVVPMTAKDRKNREARATARKGGKKNGNGATEATEVEAETAETEETASSGRGRKNR